jgi:hypothetical protein
MAWAGTGGVGIGFSFSFIALLACWVSGFGAFFFLGGSLIRDGGR